MKRSKRFRVVVSDKAAADLHGIQNYFLANAPHLSAKWLEGLSRSIDSLALAPARCGRAREAEEFGEDLRQLLFGRRRAVYRIVFRIGGDAGVVEVLHVLHSARDTARP